MPVEKFTTVPFSSDDLSSISFGGGGGISINVVGIVFADNDEQVDNLVAQIKDSLEFRNTVLG